MLYVYAILRSRDVNRLTLAGTGIGGYPLAVHAGPRLAVVVSEHAQRIFTRSAQNIVTHERVIEAAMAQATLLPTRFGTRFDNADVLDATVERHADVLAAGLDHVEGCVELGLRIIRRTANQAASRVALDEAADRTPPASGIEYMRRRLVKEQKQRRLDHDAEAIWEAVHPSLAALARDSVRRPPPSGRDLAAGMVSGGAYLVPCDDAEHFRVQVDRLGQSLGDVGLICTGPWPPYHFVPGMAAAEVSHA